MLKQRIVTASVLMTCLVSVLFFSPWYVFSALVGLVFLVGAWEWARLSDCISVPSRVLYLLTTAGLGAGGYVLMGLNADFFPSLLVVTACWWALAILWIQGYPASSILWRSRLVRMIMGWLVLLPAWLSCVHVINLEHGRWLVALIVIIVSAADVGAYFSGRAFGRRKLAAKVSPGKSWEGVWGGMLCASVSACAFIYCIFGENWSWLVVAIILPAAAVSVVGDLLESMLKRHCGVKDSGHILPGHGGILDRVDGMVAAVPVFTLLMHVTQWSP